MAVNCEKLKGLGYASIDDLPAGMLDGLDAVTLAVVAAELPTRKAAPLAIDYGKGKLPSRAAIVRALQEDDGECGGPGSSLTLAAQQLVLSARQGNLAAWDRIADRLDGKPQQSVEMDVHMSLEQLIMASFKLETGGTSGGTSDKRTDAITIESDGYTSSSVLAIGTESF